jgi:hypothetical protein
MVALAGTLTFLVLRSALVPVVKQYTPPHWPLALEPGLTYLAPVPGPTTPLTSEIGGGMWLINAATDGQVSMDFTRYVVAPTSSPFAAGNDSLRLNARTDFDVAPDPAITGPLRSVFYIVPGKNFMTLSSGPTQRNGAIAFFSGREFVAGSPFNRSVFYHFALGFDPAWTGEDPASSGQMLVQPIARTAIIGIYGYPRGPYRYFWASDGSHTVVFEVTYVHEGDSSETPSGRAMFFNETLSAPPFVYYNQERVNSANEFRSGPGQAILLPLANGTLEIANVTGAPHSWVPLALAGHPALISGPLGFVRATFPIRIYLPLRSVTEAGVAAFDLSTEAVVWEYSVGGPGVILSENLASFRGDFLPVAWFDAGNQSTRVVGLDGSGIPIPQFAATIPGRVRTVFEVIELSEVFLYVDSGTIVSLSTSFPSSSAVTPKTFPLRSPSNKTSIAYVGSPGGTLYGSGLIPRELYAAWTDSGSAESMLFALWLPP